MGPGSSPCFLGFYLHLHVCIKNITIFGFGSSVWGDGPSRLPIAPIPKTHPKLPEKLSYGQLPMFEFQERSNTRQRRKGLRRKLKEASVQADVASVQADVLLKLFLNDVL